METPKSTRQGGNLAIFFFFLIILSMSAFAWETFNYNEARNGIYGEETAFFDSSNIYTSISDGAGFQPLIADIDGDGIKEILGSDGNYLKVWHLSGGVLALEDEYNFGATQRAMMTIIPNTTDGDSYLDIIYPFETNNFTIIEYNGSGFVQIKSYEIGGAIQTAPVCTNTTHSSQVACWIGNNDGNITEIAWNGTDYSAGAIINFSEDDVFTSTNGLTHPPIISDIDNDGIDEIVFICDQNNDAGEELCSWPVNSGSGIFEGTTGNLTNEGSIVGGMTAYDFDDAGHEEVFVTYYSTTGGLGAQDCWMAVYKSDLSTAYFSTKKIIDSGGTETTRISNPVIGDFVSTLTDDNIEACAVATQISTGTNDNTYIACYDDDGDKVFDYDYGFAVGNDVKWWNPGGTIAGANLYDDGDGKYELIVGGAILSLDDPLIGSDNVDNHINFTTTASAEVTTSIAIGEFQTDLSADVCGQRSGNVFCSYMSITNDLPVLDEFNINTGNPVCINDSVIISASEGDDYTNDLVTDSERIAVLWPNGTTQYGSYSSTNPSLTFIAPIIPGTYGITIYLQQYADSTDTSVYSTYSLITSSNNATCMESGESGTTSSTTGAIISEDEDISGFFCYFFEGFGLSCGGFGTTIIWFVMMMGVLFSLLQMGIREALPILLAEGGMLIMGGLLGVVSGWVVFILGFMIGAFLIVSIFGNNGQGGI